MAKWSENPVYTPLSDINSGKKYTDGDGIFIEDINKLFENLKNIRGE